MDVFVLLATMFFCFIIGVPIAYSLALAAMAGAIYIGIPLEAVMLKISDGVSKVAMLTIVLTFFGAAACYRQGRHMNIGVFVGMMPDAVRRVVVMLAEMLVGVFAIFMAYYGARLVMATWYNTIGDFPALSVGVTYLPIPIGGAILLCFVLERIILGRPPEPEGEAAAVH